MIKNIIINFLIVLFLFNFANTQEPREEDTNICSLPLVTGPCRADMPRYRFNGTQCVLFYYGGCQGNRNNFDSLQECKTACPSVKSNIIDTN